MDQYDKDVYFELRDKLIKRLPEPEKSVYGYFRQVERTNLEKHGRLIVDGKTAIDITAEHFMMNVEETKSVCLSATKELTELIQKY